MAQVIRVSKPGYNALTDNNPDHFSLYSDQDWVLVKEYTRGVIQATSDGNYITFPMSYNPLVFVFYLKDGVWRSVTGQLYDPSLEDYTIYPVILISYPIVVFFGDNPSTPTTFKYFICYDRV